MAKFDHLSLDELWDLAYATAKNKKSRKKTWQELMSPDYAAMVYELADEQLERLDREIVLDPTESKTKARTFIAKIKGQAQRSTEIHTAQERNQRKHKRVQDALEYIEYLKDSIEDLRTFVPDESIEFDLHTSIESFERSGSSESDLDTWISNRKARRG